MAQITTNKIRNVHEYLYSFFSFINNKKKRKTRFHTVPTISHKTERANTQVIFNI